MMSKTITEQVASYIYDKNVSYGIYNVFACYNSLEDYDNRKVDFYDIYDNNGCCMSEGEPFYDMPDWGDVFDWFYAPAINETSKGNPRDLKWAIKEEY